MDNPEQAKGSKKSLIIGIILVILVAGAVYGYFKYSELYPSTDNAYVNSNLIDVAPKVSGYIKQIYVKNNQTVKRGDLLFTIDPIDYALNHQGAQKNYDSQLSQEEVAKQQLEVQRELISKDKVQYHFALDQKNRYIALNKANTVSKQIYETIMTDYSNAKSQLEIDTKKYQQYLSLYNMTQSKSGASKASMEEAKSNLDHTKYYSPVNGYVTNLNGISAGEFLSASQKVFGIVDNENWWIDANFKETQLRRIKVGQKVTVELDMYSHKYQGTVQSLSYASGSTFSLLPAQNATGNWVKVTQRFTVRVKLDNDLNYPLRVGASAVVTVNTREGN